MEKTVYLVTKCYTAEGDLAQDFTKDINANPQIFTTKEAAEAEMWNRVNTSKEHWEFYEKAVGDVTKKSIRTVDDANSKEIWFGNDTEKYISGARMITLTLPLE